jgi:tellurite resistance protein TehA-like permease
MRRVLTRMLFSFLTAMTAVLIVVTSIAVLVGLIRGPHEAAADLESAMSGYWPLFLVAIVVLTIGLSAVGRGQVDA